MELLINLPDINGCFDVGLAAQSEVQLTDAKKLKILSGPISDSTLKQIIDLALVELNHQSLGMDTLQRSVLFGGAIVCLKAGLCGTYQDKPDGAWMHWDIVQFKESKDALTDQHKEEIIKAASPENLSTCATYIAATKINWYKENHHVGQGSFSGYIAKVVRAKNAEQSVQSLYSVIHQIGHFASTAIVLKKLGLDHIRGTNEFYTDETGNTFSAAADAKLRIASNPAGTARHFIAKALAKRLLSSSVVAFCPNVIDFKALWDSCKNVEAAPARYHIGAVYLCGEASAAKFEDGLASAYLGRLGTYGNAFLSASTLMKSPHVKDDRYKNCDDFSSDFEQALRSYKIAMAKASGKVNLGVGILGGAAGYISVAKYFEVTPNKVAIEALKSTDKKEDEEVQDEEMEGM